MSETNAKIHIVVDSTAKVPPTMLEKFDNLSVVPLKIIIGGEEWNETELTNADLFRLVREKGVHPQTSQPSPGDFAKAFAPAEAGDFVIMIGLSGGVSGTVDSARAVARGMKNSRNIFVVDSGTTSLGMIKLAETALTMAQAGEAAGDIADRLTASSRKTHTFFVPSTLEYLHKGGRIGGAAALFGSILQIKPILYLVDGKIQVLDKVRTTARAQARMLAELYKYDKLKYIGVAHGEVPEAAQAIYQKVQERYPRIDIVTGDIGAVISSHVGPGVTGLIFEVE